MRGIDMAGTEDRSSARKLLWSVLLALCAGSLFADTSGAIAGSVRDSSGGAIQGAVVEAREGDSGVVRRAITNEAGAYHISGLRSGTHEMLASHASFEDVRRPGLVVRSGDEIRIDLTLSLKGQSESIVVTETTSLTDVESAAASTVVNQRDIQDLPSDGRQLQNLALIVPGVSAGWNLSTAANRYGRRGRTEGAFTVNGAR